MLEFLQPMNVTQHEFAKHLKVPVQRINVIVRGRRSITPETALLFAKALGTSAELWMNMQGQYDLAMAQQASPAANVTRLRSAG